MNKRQMIDYLANHFRYDTMNSWNRSTSYACKVKLCAIQFPDSATRDRANELLEVEEAFYETNRILRDFDARHGYEWQIGTNGRSGGYWVLYQGGAAFSYPGKATDQSEDFADWDMESLRARVKLVKDFDATCARAIKAFIGFCATHCAKETTVSVPKKVWIAEEVKL